MLELVIPETEMFDEATQSFVYVKETKLVLEHSLVSISKWESKHHKAFLEKTETHTNAEMLDYIKDMTITQNVSDKVYSCLTADHMNKIADYINDSMTATWFNERQKTGGREVITSDLIYYWMVAFQIPMECQKWHLNRLLTLIRICNIKQEKPEKMSPSAIKSSNRSLNAARRARLNSRG